MPHRMTWAKFTEIWRMTAISKLSLIFSYFLSSNISGVQPRSRAVDITKPETPRSDVASGMISLQDFLILALGYSCSLLLTI